MKEFENQTDGLRHLLRLWSRDAAGWVGFPAKLEKVAALDEKWAEVFGTRLPTHVRHARRQRGQPCAYAFCHPRAGLPGTQRWVWLLRTDGDLGPPDSSWQREVWQISPPELGDAEVRLKIAREPRPRGDWRWTWRLGDRHRNMIGSEWRDHVVAGRGEDLRFAVERAGKSLPMFGGVRQQLLNELEMQRRRWHKLHPTRPWPAAIELPRMGKFMPGKAESPESKSLDNT